MYVGAQKAQAPVLYVTATNPIVDNIKEGLHIKKDFTHFVTIEL